MFVCPISALAPKQGAFVIPDTFCRFCTHGGLERPCSSGPFITQENVWHSQEGHGSVCVAVPGARQSLRAVAKGCESFVFGGAGCRRGRGGGGKIGGGRRVKIACTPEDTAQSRSQIFFRRKATIFEQRCGSLVELWHRIERSAHVPTGSAAGYG